MERKYRGFSHVSRNQADERGDEIVTIIRDINRRIITLLITYTSFLANGKD